LWYLSSALSSNTGKSILTRFRYPVTLTFVQFAFVAGYSLLVLAVRNKLAQFQHHRSRTTSGGGLTSGSKSRRGSFGAISMNTLQGWGVRKPTKNMFNGTFMMSLFQIAGHVFSSMAIARVPVSTVHTIKVRSLFSLARRRMLLIFVFSNSCPGSITSVHRTLLRRTLRSKILDTNLHLPIPSHYRSHVGVLFRPSSERNRFPLRTRFNFYFRRSKYLLEEIITKGI
jgi:hypothetical protein